MKKVKSKEEQNDLTSVKNYWKRHSKSDRRPWYIKALDNGLVVVLILVVIFAIIQGRYIAKEVIVVEVCEGVPISDDYNITFQTGEIDETNERQNPTKTDGKPS